MPHTRPPEPIALVQERLEVSKREVERGRVVVRTRVEERDEIAEAILRIDEVTVERVAIGEIVTTAPTVREEDGVLIVPVLEEELVFSIRLVLKEEIRITRRDRDEHFSQSVRLRREHADVVRSSAAQPEQPTDEGNET